MEAVPETRVLDAAEKLLYGRGLQAVGMDAIRNESGVSLKRLYQLFPSKERLVEAYLRRRDVRWRASLAGYVDARPAEENRILAVFDWLESWFEEPGFRGCAFVNSFGELGATSEGVASAARDHADALKRYLAGLVDAEGHAAWLPEPLFLLMEGAITTAAISGSSAPAGQAREAARRLLDADEVADDEVKAP
ncbi:TetR/AcrR family transcriptional regulator [Streptomyces lunaelactis]|uniref:TetR/AcrR family transcriptional regulator n=1 Tax=Streptomyces lunaelactis TaxID=1535768 RepID=UPI0015852FFD|nr:TetR/AcrR family transcriptional regulator [Streptomyces lunaelactis]NUK04465.1 TetR/AcrR family transcriptional regulator [Streptomyces lunaelactis]NUK11244.1 TetR/AcrR family transcriptional regulator [Streptomyces lunaelactis]NUK19002.1 TetR/AcrR family transcriptional regulator [Streptomyces lunaelactis]NUK26283.1 TetR/AcrR family transcriptional regulator [Streptomyces lunaelactis]NUK37635.1 TetR/AcrR family transcriptional regulator [Streptomyces lunaelactis]